MESKTKKVTMEAYRTALVRADPNISKAQRAFLRAHYQSANHRATASHQTLNFPFHIARSPSTLFPRL